MADDQTDTWSGSPPAPPDRSDRRRPAHHRPAPQTLDLLAPRLAQLSAAADPPVLFPSPKGLLRNPNNTSGDLRQTLDRVGCPWATSHTFRRTVATRLDDARLSARQIADHLGHSRPSLTQDVPRPRHRQPAGRGSPLAQPLISRASSGPAFDAARVASSAALTRLADVDRVGPDRPATRS